MLMNGVNNNRMTFSFKHLLPASHTHWYFLTSHLSFSLLKPGFFSSSLPSPSPITFCQQIQSTFFSLFIARWQLLACRHVLLFGCSDGGICPASSDLPPYGFCQHLLKDLSQDPTLHFFSPRFPGLFHSFFCFQLLPICWYFFNLHLVPTWPPQLQIQSGFF